MKKYAFVILIAFLAACGGKQDDPQAIRKEIDKYRQESRDLEDKIEVLQSKLDLLEGVDIHADALPVVVKNVQPEYFAHHFSANGSLEAIQSAVVSPEMNGQIKSIHVSEGQFVNQGQLLVSLNASVLRSSVAEVEVGLQLARTLYEKQKELWDQNVGTEVQFLQAKNQVDALEKRMLSLQEQIKMTEIHAPFSGIVDEINFKQGEVVAPGMQVVNLVNLSQMYANFDVSENYITTLKEGDSVFVEFPAYPELSIHTSIFRIGNVIKEGSRTFQVQVKIANTKNQLKPNAIAMATMRDFETTSALLVPSIAVVQDMKGQFVFVAEAVQGGTLAAKRYVEIGRSDNANTMLVSGVKAGESVITKGYNLVKNGNPVAIQ